MPENQEAKQPLRAGLYVDGFNLYHPIDDTGDHFLKWISLWRLGEILCAPKGLQLVKVVFCTAVDDQDPAKQKRHNTFNSAQTACGVTVIKGHHVVDAAQNKRSEKQSDINLALSVMMDAEDDIFDWAYLLSADSDQAATGRVFKERHPTKCLVSVAPPDKSPPHKLIPFCAAHFALKWEQIEAAVMPGQVQGRSGLIVRPSKYDPPEWWVHPDQRP